MLRQVTHIHTVLLLCLSLPALLLLRSQLGASAGHMDEYDYLFVGRTLLAGDHWPTHSYIFGWDLNWLLLAWGDTTFGGLEGARIIAAGLGAISIVAMYAFVYSLWSNRSTALIAALLLGFEGAHLYTSGLATYDIISFTAFICALPCVLLSCRSTRWQLFWTLLSCAALCIAALSKYTTIIYLPLIAALVLWHSPRQAVIGIVLIAFVLIAYVVLNLDQLKTLYEIQIQGTHGSNATLSDILFRAVRQLWVILLLAVIGLIYSTFARHSTTRTILILAAFSLPLFLYHLASQNVISLQKHLAFCSLFLIPIAAWGMNEFYTQGARSHLRGAIVLCCIGVFALTNVNKLRTMQKSYPNVHKISTFANQIQASDYVLSEDPYLFRYLLIDTVAQAQINETTWLDNNLDGIYEMLDVKQAIWDRKFDYVFLNDQQHPETNLTLRKMLLSRNYDTIFENSYELQTMSGEKRSGAISLYQKTELPPTTLENQADTQSLL